MDENLDLDRLAQDVRYLRDRADIQECIAKYCRGLDRLDADMLREAFHPDATYHHVAFHGGRDAFVTWAIDLMALFARTHHGITTQSIEVSGNEAHAESYCQFQVAQSDGVTLGAGAARYIDRLERRSGRWAISTRVALIDFGHELLRSTWYGDAELPTSRSREDYAYRRPLTPVGDPIAP